MQPLTSKLDIGSDDYVANAHTARVLVEDLRAKFDEAACGGGAVACARHRGRGKLLPRDRVKLLVDPGSFIEIAQLAARDMYGGDAPSAGLVAGIGNVEGVPCVIVADDPTVKNGAHYPMTIKKHLRALEIAEQNRLPCIHVVDSGGPYLHKPDDFPDRDHLGPLVCSQARLRAKGIPQVAILMGKTMSGGACLPAMSDDVIAVRGVSDDGDVSADHLAENESHAVHLARCIVGTKERRRTIPSPPSEDPLYDPREIYGVIPREPDQAFDLHEVIARIVDGSRLDELDAACAPEVVTGFARIHGAWVGIVASNGPLVGESASKAASFVHLSVQQVVPLLFLHNALETPLRASRSAVKEGANLLAAVATASVPKLTVLMGGSFGAGNPGLCGRAYGPRFLWTWPNSRTKTVSSDEGRAKTVRASELQGHAYYATARLWDDGVIDPAETRRVLGVSLRVVVDSRVAGRHHLMTRADDEIRGGTMGLHSVQASRQTKGSLRWRPTQIA